MRRLKVEVVQVGEERSEEVEGRVGPGKRGRRRRGGGRGGSGRRGRRRRGWR